MAVTALGVGDVAGHGQRFAAVGWRIRAARPSATSARTSLQATRAPSAAKPDATVPPMFGLAPVTIATLPASRSLMAPSTAARYLPED